MLFCSFFPYKRLKERKGPICKMIKHYIVYKIIILKMNLLCIYIKEMAELSINSFHLFKLSFYLLQCGWSNCAFMEFLILSMNSSSSSFSLDWQGFLH